MRGCSFAARVLRATCLLVLALTLARQAGAQRFILSYTVDSSANVGQWSSLELDSGERPHISYLDATNDRLKYARLVDGAFEIEIVDTDGSAGRGSALALDQADDPHISYYAEVGPNAFLMHATRTAGGPWTTEPVATLNDLPPGQRQWTSIQVDSRGRPHIAFHQSDGLFLGYAVREASGWDVALADPDPVFLTGYSAALALDAQDLPHISYVTWTTASDRILKYASKPAGIWLQEPVRGPTSGLGFTSIGIQPSGMPVIAFVELQGATPNLVAAFRGATNWDFETVDEASAAAFGRPLSLAMTGAGEPRIAYFKRASSTIQLAERDAGSWSTRVAVNAAGEPSLEIDAGGGSHVSYYDRDDGSLRYRGSVELAGITVTPENPSVDLPGAVQFSADGGFANGSVFDIGDFVTWASVNTAVATISERGLATAVGPGVTAITATVDGVIGQTTLTVAGGEPTVMIHGQPARQWRLNAFPAATTMADIVDDLGAPAPSSWKMGHWSPSISTYIELTTGLEPLTIGWGYWLITGGERTVQTAGFPPTADHVVPLQAPLDVAPAWNQLGNPFDADLPVTSILVTANGTDLIPIGDAANQLTDPEPRMWISASGSYAAQPVLPAGEGVWIRKIATGPVSVVFRPAGVAGVAGAPPSTSPARREEAIDPGGKPAGADWALRLRARQGGLRAEPLWIGAAPVPAGAWNRLCSAAAPAPPDGEFLTLHLPRPEWGRMSGAYVRVFEPAAPSMGWELVVRGAGATGEDEIELEIDAFDLPPGTDLRLADLDHDNVFELEPGEPISIAPTPRVRRFRLEAALPGATTPARVAAVTPFPHAYPNPFRNESAFRLLLAEPGDLRVTIYDSNGRAVRTLERSGARPGEHVVSWDGRDAGGNPLAAGIYFARYRAGDTRGSYRLVKLK